MTKPPSSLGYRMPAEWEPHEATWLVWPHNASDWPGKFMAIPWVYTEIVCHLTASETVRIVVQSSEHEKKTLLLLKRAGIALDKIETVIQPTNRGWIRDSGPIVLQGESPKSQPAAAHFRFNAWAKYGDWDLDRKIPQAIAKRHKLELFTAKHKNRHVVLEGGSIDVNGKGTLLTTEECLLDKKVQVRNPEFSRKDLEKVLKDYLGVKCIVWLGNGIEGDDTHGHVDDLCRFVNPTTIVMCQEENAADANYLTLQESWDRVPDIRLQDGKKPEVIALPMPGPVMFDGMRLPASYANFYIANSTVLVPTFNDPNDRIALGILSELFPGRTVIGIHAVDLVWGLGTLHCLTREHPRTS